MQQQRATYFSLRWFVSASSSAHRFDFVQSLFYHALQKERALSPNAIAATSTITRQVGELEPKEPLPPNRVGTVVFPKLKGAIAKESARRMTFKGRYH